MAENVRDRSLRRALWHVVYRRSSRRSWLWLRDVLNALLDDRDPPSVPKVNEELPRHPDE